METNRSLSLSESLSETNIPNGAIPFGMVNLLKAKNQWETPHLHPGVAVHPGPMTLSQSEDTGRTQGFFCLQKRLVVKYLL
jgi:hypothetical protein